MRGSSCRVPARLIGCLAGIVVALLGLLAPAATAEPLPPPADEVFTLAARRAPDGVLAIRIAAAPGHYLYRDGMQAVLDGRALPLALPAGTEKDDPNFGLVEIYHDAVEARLADAPAAGRLRVSYQGCAERGICYPPVAKVIDLATLAVSDPPSRMVDGTRVAVAPGGAAADAQGPASASTPSLAPEPDATAGLLAGGWGPMLAAFLLFGVLLALTPCVFPMIPILSGMLVRSGETLSPRRGFVLSASYVIAMAAAYGLLGLAAGWSGANLQAALQTPWALGLMAAALVALALSMFGLFDIALPAGLAARLGGARGGGGSITGAALLGFASALVVGPCVTPPLAAAMLYAAQTGEAGKGAAALFMLGLGMGLPLVAVGTFGARVLPRSGPWLARVKQIFGVVFLAVAASLLTRILPGPAALAVWGVLALAAGVFLGGFDRLGPASEWRGRLGKAAGLAAATYGVLLLVGAAGGANDPLRPLAFLMSDHATTREAPAPTRVASLAAFDRAVAAHTGGPVLVAFTADWCTVCRSNEAVLSEPAIRARLARLPVIAADVTTYGDDTRALMARFAVVGPPTLFLLDAAGREIPGSRLIGPITADEIARRLAAAGA
ncbi:protein-disulfide reductase DsbD [Rhodoplanes sp. TEM]|uniref:Protein-disulfide reductase DsbD n=1 Tax=Rhodoplanes tepidamans TaxID=200616 RepID=A0ABT5JH66_RHOTP|nr:MULTISPECIES: protein-disulfide reductase DsbD [Rhodoplanes]MDC7788706.1 protein-disulfide reductase DsbD [Rhodoplanes tepidamans]MDC7982698.1 protein-disulfide reductase DsbD [Rhodoplanes sp. TEM]MDQ0357654.1 thiol:disulfide interchange protein DsbD [Rhodoplanes tepidamans]